MSLLAAQKLRKSYRSRQVVQDLSLEIATGEVVGLLGPNGAGKTTSFYMIVGLVHADAGQVTLDGHDITRYTLRPARAPGRRLSAAGSFGVPQA